jgi:hypothetical protein
MVIKLQGEIDKLNSDNKAELEKELKSMHERFIDKNNLELDKKGLELQNKIGDLRV